MKDQKQIGKTNIENFKKFEEKFKKLNSISFESYYIQRLSEKSNLKSF